MDQLLSQLIPTQRVGNDGFNWWVGQVEGTASDEKNNKGGYRYKVRIVGDHPESGQILPTKDLPWANVIMPVNVPFMPGNVGGANPQLRKGCWVVGFYLDSDKQKPIIMGSIGQTPGATTVVNNERPENKNFTTAIPSNVNPATDGLASPENPKGNESDQTNKSTGGLSDGATNEDGSLKVPLPFRKVKGQKDEKWCQTVADRCDNQDIKSKTTILLGEFLAEVQNNGGNIGTYLVSSVTGTINSGINIARKYVNKFMFVVRHFVAKVKGFVIEKLTNAVKDLINALIYPSEEGNSLTPVTEWFNKILKDLGCQMADLGDRLAEWLTNVLMSYINQIYRAAACQIDTLVNGILSKMNSLMEQILRKVLGPIQDILGAIALPLNIIGGAINFALNLLGISCSGPNNICAEYKTVCTDGEKKKEDDGKNFLDNLLSSIDNLFPATGADYTQYVCEDAYTGNSLKITTVGFVGGVPKLDGPKGDIARKRKIIYTIDDIRVEEGNQAVFTVTRSGYVESSSSVSFKTLKKGSATSGEDYLPEEGILGFAPNETSKTITINTLFSEEREGDEDFYIRILRNSPGQQSGIGTNFTKNVGKCTITERNIKEIGSPYIVKNTNPEIGISETFPEGETDVPTDVPTDIEIIDTLPRYTVTANKSSYKEGEFIIYTINTKNVENGTILYYTLSGNEITSGDIIGGKLTGNFVINNNTAKVTIGLEEDNVVEEEEILRFTINNTGALVDILIVSDNDTNPNDISNFDESEGETVENSYESFRDPEFGTSPDPSNPDINPNQIITDSNGGIISIPVANPGDPWEEPPYIFIGGEGIGAVATPLLDENGFITEVRIKSPGYGYKLNLASDVGVRCIIDTFTVIRPGIGYTSKPDIYINGELNVAEAIINDDGFVIGARILDRTKTFPEFPNIEIIGGGGYGAKLLPSLVCLDTEGLVNNESTKIGTGRYVDCP